MTWLAATRHNGSCRTSTCTSIPGDIGCLLGASGCGKTTTQRAIAGFEPVHEGEIRLAGEVICLQPPTGSQLESIFPSHLDYRPGTQVGVRVAAEHLVLFQPTN